MRMSRRIGLYSAGGEVLYNLYNNGTVSDAIGGFTQTTSAGALTMGATSMSIGQSTGAILCLVRTNKPIKADKLKAITASMVLSNAYTGLNGVFGYSTSADATTLAELTTYKSFNGSTNGRPYMLSLDLSEVTGNVYVYVGYNSTSSGFSGNQSVAVVDISTVIDKGVVAVGDLYNAGVVHEKIGGFVKSGGGVGEALTINSTSMAVSSNNVANFGTFARTKYPIKMDDLSSLTITWTKVTTSSSALAYFGYAEEGSVISNTNLDGKVSATGAANDLTLDVSSVTGYAYIYFGVQPTAGGYASAPKITVTKISAIAAEAELADAQAALSLLGVE